MVEEERRRASAPEAFRAGFETYLSPLTFRYGSKEVRRIWSQENFWLTARRIWVAVAEVQQEAGLLTPAQVADLREHQSELSVERIFQLEKEVGHDVVAAIIEFSEVAPKGGEILHQGLTSEDILSNVETLQIQESLGVVEARLTRVLEAFAGQIEKHKDLVCMGYTHLQAAEPITMGYRLAKYAQDFLLDLKLLDKVRDLIKAKGVKGAVGTSASFQEILAGREMSVEEHERKIMERLGLEPAIISDQTYPRKNLFLTQTVLASVGQSVHRFGLDLQILQSSPIGEVSEPRRKSQVGSSAMPHKRNPINSENICSLTETLPGILQSSWTTAAFITLERTLRDSAGKRSWLPEAFLIIDESLSRTERVVGNLVVYEGAVRANLERFAPFCAMEIVLVMLTQAGMDRKEAHEILREHAEKAVEATREGQPNPLKELLLADERLVGILNREAVDSAFDKVYRYVGIAPEACDRFLQTELYPAIGRV